MKHKQPLLLLAIFGLIFLFTVGCDALLRLGGTPTPTFTNAPTVTLIPTQTPTLPATSIPTSTSTPIPTVTQTSTPTPTQEPTLSCSVSSGSWESKQLAEGLFRLLSYEVRDCKVTFIEIWAFPAKGELFWFQEATDIGILDDAFIYSYGEGNQNFTVEGACDSPTSCRGTIFFPQGFLVVDYTLPRDVTLPWTASPK